MAELLCYTRKADKTIYYEERLAYSMHLALLEGEKITVLNHNSGVLFAKATERENGSLCPKSLRDPVIVRGEDNRILIHAIRIEGDGDEELTKTSLYWTTEDFVIYTELTEEEAKTFAAFKKLSDVTKYEGDVSDIVGCIPGNKIELTENETDYIKKKLLTPENCGVSVPDQVMIEKMEDLEQVKANVHYTDGTSVLRKIDWNLHELDTEEKGTQTITGRIHQDSFAFPLMINRADPCVARWNGKYYYIATNDADNNHTLYIREADTLAGLANANEHLLLDSVTYEGVGNLLWAPEFHEINGQLYIFHACTPDPFFCEESHIMTLREGGNPCDRNDWSAPKRIVRKDGSELCPMGRTITLDMTCFFWEGDYYVIWSQREFLPEDLGAWLYIAKLNPEKPWMLLTDPVVLSKPDYGWANNHTFVDEGPFALISGDRLFVTFSSAAVDETYVVSYLVIEPGKDLLNPANWRKNNYPILSARSVEGEYGTGHNAYVIDEEGLVWNTYHARPGADGPRSSGFRRVHFDIDGCPMLDVTEDKDLKECYRNVTLQVQFQ